MPNPTEIDHGELFPEHDCNEPEIGFNQNAAESYHGISTRSNARSIELSRRPNTPETSPILHVTKLAQPCLSSYSLSQHNQQADINRVRQTRDWVNNHCSSSIGRVNIVERRDVIDKQLREANALASELARIKTREQNSESVKGLKNKAKCKDLRFIGGWVDEKDKRC